MSEKYEPKHKMDESLYRMRHSLAHILAEAVLQVRPKAQLGFGPPVRTGFYYDMLLEEPLAESDLPDIEKRMRKIIQEKQQFKREDLPKIDALKKLEGMGQELKVEYAKELLQETNSLSFYTSGPFVDMCEGPHVDDTSKIPVNAFKLDSIAGSYWRGDSNRPMLTRIYGLAFPTENELKEFIKNRELALKRDHRKLGQELELFAIDEHVGKGLPLWLPNGTVIREELEKFAKELEFRDGYVRVATPHIANGELYKLSGHLQLYKDAMFPPMRSVEKDPDAPQEEFYLKPMNCPHHHMIYLNRPRSYRELPLRLAEYGTVYRFEKSGQLAGLLRVRGLAMNDAHIYCTRGQIQEEIRKVVAMHKFYFEKFRMDKIWVRLSLHDQDKEKFTENEQLWTETENILREVLKALAVDYEEVRGEAAFYGPKIDYQTENVLGREETVATVQLDFTMPERFKLEYTDSDGSKQRPFIIHRAPLGTHERFISFLIERWGGAFPTWLSPLQVRLVPVAEEFLPYAEKLAQEIRENMARVEVDATNDSFSKKVRNAITKKIPNIWIVGANEVKDQTVTWRRYAAEKQVQVPAEKAKAALKSMVDQRIMDNFSDIQLPL
ncbi:MAG TPA: threonine--tRNA ligase [bacterium]|nr:threonine--tRNA ligase [bacterium]